VESSQFTHTQSYFESIEQIESQGATCDTFRVKLYGKLHFLKRLKPEYAGDIRYREALRKEFETGYQLEHPGLPRYISHSDDGILMDYIDGETLSQALQRRPDYFQDRKNTDKFLSQLTNVVGYLHDHQVLHLDLKPDNILLTRIGSDVKIVDFGCSYTDTFTDTTGHTEGFAAPEQLSIIDCPLSIRTDIYAIGKIIELLPNHHIYNKVIARCTASDPADRYQTVEEIQRDVKQKKSRLRYVSILVAIVVASLIGITFWTRQQTTIPVGQEPTIDSLPNHANSSQDTAPQAHDPATVPPSPKQNPAPEISKDDQTLMKEEAQRLIDKAYRATIASFCDSVWPPVVDYPGNPWADYSTAFHDQVVQIGDQLVKKYPSVQESVIRQETEMRFQSLVGYVFNKMRDNGQQSRKTASD